MALKTFNPTTPGQRQLVMVDRSSLYKGKPVKALTEGKHVHGRPQQRPAASSCVSAAAATSRPTASSTSSAPRSICPPPSSGWNTIRTAPPSSRSSSTPTAPRPISWRRSGLRSATRVIAGDYVDVKPGNVMPLGNMPVGTIVHNVELKIGKGGQLARSAGTYAQIVGRDQDYVHRPPELGRAAPGSRPLHRHHRCGVEPGPHEHLDRQGRPQPLAWPQAA